MAVSKIPKDDNYYKFVDVSNYTSWEAVYNALDSSPATVGTCSIGDQDSAPIKQILPNPSSFSSYTYVEIRRSGPSGMPILNITAYSLLRTGIAICSAYNNASSWVRTGWQIIN